MSIQAIETEYKGYKFRSRLEARWAVFFDSMNVKWNYEPEGFENWKGEKYLPDFYLPEHDIWCEVKPNDTSRSDEIIRACSFVQKDLKIRGLILLPNIPEPKYNNSIFWYRCAYYNTLEQDTAIVRVAFDTFNDWPKDEEKFFIYFDCICVGYSDVIYPYPYSYSALEWDATHDFDMPYKDVFGERKTCLHKNKTTDMLDEAYKKARQARFCASVIARR